MIPAPSKEQSIQLLKGLVNINTYSTNYEGISKCIDKVSQLFSIFNCHIQRCYEPTRLNNDICSAIIFTKKLQKKPSILCSIHLDTVFSPDCDFQEFHQLSPSLATGPGVIDAKGGIVILYNFLSYLEISPLAQEYGWTVLISTDEEIGSPYSKHLLVNAAKEHDFAMVFEPALTNGNLIHARPASANISISATGKAGHAGRDAQTADNAILKLINFLSTLQHTIPLTTSEHTINIGTISGGKKENIIPDCATSHLNARFMDEHLLNSFIQTCHSLSKQHQVTVEVNALRPAKPRTAHSTILYSALLQSAHDLSMTISIEDSFGVSDANYIASGGIGVIDTLGALGSGMHTFNETIQLDSLMDRSKLAFQLLTHIQNSSN